MMTSLATYIGRSVLTDTQQQLLQLSLRDKIFHTIALFHCGKLNTY